MPLFTAVNKVFSDIGSMKLSKESCLKGIPHKLGMQGQRTEEGEETG
jgi:hypothetical protein